MEALSNQVVFEQGKHTVQTKYGTVIFDVPRAITLQEFTKAFSAIMKGA